MAIGIIDICDVLVNEGHPYDVPDEFEKQKVFYCSECDGSLEMGTTPDTCPHCGVRIKNIVNNIGSRRTNETQSLLTARTRIANLIDSDKNETVKEYLTYALAKVDKDIEFYTNIH